MSAAILNVTQLGDVGGWSLPPRRHHVALLGLSGGGGVGGAEGSGKGNKFRKFRWAAELSRTFDFVAKSWSNGRHYT